MEFLSKQWFELQEHRRRLFSRAVWIPVYGARTCEEGGKLPDIGYVEECLAVGSALVFHEHREKADELDWHSWTVDNTAPYLAPGGEYLEADHFCYDPEIRLGTRLVLTQYLNSDHPRQVFLNQDFLMAYGLLQEGDHWLRPNEGYEQVARCARNPDGSIAFVEIRAEYLKDYLAARNAALRLYYYRQRRAVLDVDPRFGWPESGSLVAELNDRLEVRCTEINSAGVTAGTTWSMHKSWRTDVDADEEVPDFSGNDEEVTESESTSVVRGGDPDRFLVSGEMWRGEWIEPADKSVRLGYGEPKEVLMVQPDGDGGRVDLETLNFEEVGKYLWFRPEVINDLLSRRGATLKWYTQDTGGVSAFPNWLLHFGVNRLGLVNAYAYDVTRRPLWERRVWVAHNCRPDGGVSAELMQAQMECRPASTKPPELLIQHAVGWIDQVFRDKFGAQLMRDHHELDELSQRIHRFRAVDEVSLRGLAKDLVKVSIERLEKKKLIAALGEKKSDQGTLKLLERLLGKFTDERYAYMRLGPLYGAYDLRGADAHLSKADIDGCYERAGVDRKLPFAKQAEQLISSVAGSFGITGNELNRHVPDRVSE